MLTEEQRRKVISELERRGRDYSIKNNRSQDVEVIGESVDYSIRDSEDSERMLGLKI